MKRMLFLLATVLVLGWTASAFAQGVQSGTIRGIVQDQQNLPVPGVSVTATSSALQGARSATTDTLGVYTLRNLPPGEYEVKFELSGFGTITQKTTVALGGTVEQNVSMRAGGVAETVNVVGETPAPIATPVIGANFRKEEIDLLATPRTIQGIAQLSPGLTENGPNAGQLVINGGFASDNVFMINGVDINDNLFATAQNLFIEDAIAETQILTSGISAEYGRFGGGVVNAITKNGGNIFSGSGRINFLNPSWTTATPFEVTRGTQATAHPDLLSRTYEGTFGGPIVKERLWFFMSGRYGSVNSTASLPQTGLVLPTNDTNKRGEIKLTGTIAQNHQIQGGYLNNSRSVTNNSGIQSFVIDPHSEVDRTFPNRYYFTNLHSLVKNKFLIDLQYSERKFEFQQTAPAVSGIKDSPFISLSCACLYNAPYFDPNDPENRNNRQFTGAVTSYWAKGGGRHETKVGYEFFRSQRTGGNSQSPTSYVFNADFATNAAGAPVLDSTGRPIPVFENGATYLEYYPAIVGATLNVDSNSLYLQDHWVINSRWSADLGARFEKVKALSTGDIRSIDTGRIVPRLATSYDASGNGDHVVHFSYGQYSSRYNEAQIGANSPVGNPAYFAPTYQGPNGQGYDFAQGFNLANYPITADNAVIQVPLANIFMADGLKSPLTHEFSASYGMNINKGKGYADIAYIYRKTNSLIEGFTTREDGTTNVVANGINAGIVSNLVYKNTDVSRREYQGMVFQTRYRLADRWTVNGHYTLQLKNDGNFEGEGTNTPGAASAIGTYPEAYPEARYFPDGRLQDFQRSRLRLWSAYTLDMGRAGDASVSGLWRVDSGRVYSLVVRNVNPTAAQRTIIRNAGYPDVSGSTHVYYGGSRGSESFDGSGVFDMSFNYNVPVFRSLAPWLKLDIYNLFNNQKLIAWNTTIAQDATTPLDSLGLRTGYTKPAAFGTATGNTVTNGNLTGIEAYPLAFSGAPRGGRTFRLALGFRF